MKNFVLSAIAAAGWFPAGFDNRSEQVGLVPATKRMELVPATDETKTEDAMRREGTQRVVAEGPRMQTVTEQVLVREASKRLEEVPAVFETVNERSETVTHRVLQTPASVREVAAPAEYATVSRQVPDTAAMVSTVEVPAS